jgi:hypothetical protein
MFSERQTPPSPCRSNPGKLPAMDVDHARQEFLTTFRRIVVAFLALLLLVAFWADRPTGAASYPKPITDSVLSGETSETSKPLEPTDTSGISLIRRPWLTFYTLVGAPATNRGALSDEEEHRFRVVVGCLAGFFFAAAVTLWLVGQRHIDIARHTPP